MKISEFQNNVVFHTLVDFCGCGKLKYSAARKCNLCAGKKSGNKIYYVPCAGECGKYVVTSDRKGGRDNSARFCGRSCASKSTYVYKLSKRHGIDPEEALNYLYSGLRFCCLGKHWAHIDDFWKNRGRGCFQDLANYCKACYLKRRKKDSRWSRTRSCEWVNEFILLLESIGSINRCLKIVNVSWPSYTRLRKKDHAFEQRVHEAKRKYNRKRYGSDISGFEGWHKPGYLCRAANKECVEFLEKNQNEFRNYVKAAAFKIYGTMANRVIEDIIKKATLIFAYSRIVNIRNFESLAKFYGRCAAFQILKGKIP